MTINWFTIRVKDFDKSKKFYGDFLGLVAEEEFSPFEGMKIAFFTANNGMKVELIYTDDMVLEDKSNSGVSLGICVSNYEEFLKRAEDNNFVTLGPTTLGKGLQCFFMKDPNGVDIQIVRADTYKHDSL